MGLYIECEAVCDNCGHYENEHDTNPTKFKKEMREKGWIIGRLVFCPKCAKEIKKQRGVSY